MVRGSRARSKFIIFGLPFAFAPFVATFLAGLSIYWISTNVWTFGQQQVVTHVDATAAEEDPGGGRGGEKVPTPAPT